MVDFAEADIACVDVFSHGLSVDVFIVLIHFVVRQVSSENVVVWTGALCKTMSCVTTGLWEFSTSADNDIFHIIQMVAVTLEIVIILFYVRVNKQVRSEFDAQRLWI